MNGGSGGGGDSSDDDGDDRMIMTAMKILVYIDISDDHDT